LEDEDVELGELFEFVLSNMVVEKDDSSCCFCFFEASSFFLLLSALTRISSISSFAVNGRVGKSSSSCFFVFPYLIFKK